MVKVPDDLSLAAMRLVGQQLSRRVGGSTGTNIIGVLHAANAMRARGQSGSIVTVLCDGGDRYSHSYYNQQWYRVQGIDIAAAALDVFEGEPAVHPDLLAAPNAVLTPHIASATLPTREAMAQLAADNLIAALGHGPNAGRPPNAIHPPI